MAGITMGDISVANGTMIETDDEKSYFRKNLEKILQENEKWLKIDDLDIWPGCPQGENFAADVFKVVIYGRRLCLGVWTDIRKNFFVKRVPAVDSSCHRFYDCSKMFRNEITAYEDILPMYQNYLHKKSKSEINELCFPKFYGHCQNLLVLQDLLTEGYQVVNRVKGFSKKECSLILQELAKFHALSLALKKDDSVSFLKTVEKLKETVFCDEHIESMTGVFWENSIKCAVRSLTESTDLKIRKGVTFLESKLGKVLSTVINVVKGESGKFEVISHGDLWNNNILLRYCESGYPTGVKFIDLQAMRYSSCVLDVMHVLFTSSRAVVYERHFSSLLLEYYDSLSSNLKNLETVPSFTFEELMSEFKRKISFGVLLGCLMLTCTTRISTSEDLENSNYKHLPSDELLEISYKSLSAGYHERLRALFSALIDCNLL